MFVYFFFFKHNTAYEMRISDSSSDVCSSDLGLAVVVGVDVDEAGGDECAVGVYLPCAGLFAPPDGHDAVAVDGDVGRDRCTPRAVDDRATPDDEVVAGHARRGWGGWACGCRRNLGSCRPGTTCSARPPAGRWA